MVRHWSRCGVVCLVAACVAETPEESVSPRATDDSVVLPEATDSVAVGETGTAETGELEASQYETWPLAVPNVDDAELRRIYTYDLPKAECRNFLGWGVSAADLNDDGRLDLVAANCAETVVLTATGASGDRLTFDEHVLDLRSTRGDDAPNVWAADIDRDGRSDLVYGGFEGVRVWRNLGGFKFAHTDNFGIPIRTENFPSSFALLDMDGDVEPDLHVGYGGVDFPLVLESRAARYWSRRLQDDFLVDAPGGFRHLPRVENVGWHALHTVAMTEREFLVLNDISDPTAHQSTFFRLEQDELVHTRLADAPITFNEVPMGGFYDWVLDDEPELWMSSADTPRPNVQMGSNWTDVAGARGIPWTGFTWSVIPDDIDLDGVNEVFISAGKPPLTDIELSAVSARWDYDFSMYDAGRGTMRQTHHSQGHSVVGMVVADLTGDGVRDIILRWVDMDTLEKGIEVWSMRKRLPRFEVSFDETCIGAVVQYGEQKRLFSPHTNTGSFGVGSYTLTFPWGPDHPSVFVTKAGRTQEVEILANHHLGDIVCE